MCMSVCLNVVTIIHFYAKVIIQFTACVGICYRPHSASYREISHSIYSKRWVLQVKISVFFHCNDIKLASYIVEKNIS